MVRVHGVHLVFQEGAEIPVHYAAGREERDKDNRSAWPSRLSRASLPPFLISVCSTDGNDGDDDYDDEGQQ